MVRNSLESSLMTIMLIYRFVKIVKMLLCCKICSYAVIYSTAIIPPPKQRLSKVRHMVPPILLALPRKGSALVVGPGTGTDVADSLIALLDITPGLLTTTGGEVEVCSDVGGGGATEEGSGAGAVDASWLGGGGEGEVSNTGGGGATEEGSRTGVTEGA